MSAPRAPGPGVPAPPHRAPGPSWADSPTHIRPRWGWHCRSYLDVVLPAVGFLEVLCSISQSLGTEHRQVRGRGAAESGRGPRSCAFAPASQGLLPPTPSPSLTTTVSVLAF